MKINFFNSAREDQRHILASLGLLFAAICFGLVPYFSRGLLDQGMPAYAIAYYRYILAGTLLLPCLYFQRHKIKEVCWALTAGAVMGLGWIGYVQALETAPVSTVGVLYMTYPVFTVVIAWVLFQDVPSPRALIAALLIVVAATIAGSPAAVSSDQLPALLFALAAPFGFGFGISVLVHRLNDLSVLGRLGTVSLGSAIVLSPLMIFSQSGQIIPATLDTWILVLGIGLFTSLFPQLVFTVCSPIVGTARTATIGSAELPTMFLVGYVAFGEAITLLQAVAGALILSAIILTGSKKARNVTTHMTN